MTKHSGGDPSSPKGGPSQRNSPPRQRPAPLPDRESRWRGLLSAGALAVVLFLLLHDSLFGGKGLVPADGILNYPPWNSQTAPSNYLLQDQYCTFIPQHEFVHQRILHGDFPLWNPYIACGMPNLGSTQGALLFPIQWILSPLDPFRAGGPAAFLKLFLAGFFTILYLRLLGASHAAAFLSGLVFSLSGFMIVWLGHPHVNCAMWIPLLLYLVESQFRPHCLSNPWSARALRVWIGFAAAFGCMLLGGHPPTSIHITIGVLVYFSFRLVGHAKEKPRARVALLLCALAAGFFLAAPQLLPYLEYYRLSSGGLASTGLHRWASHLEPNTLIHFLLPRASGSPTAGFEDLPGLLGLGDVTNFNERTGYVGILPLFLALIAVVYRRSRFTYFFLGSAAFSLLVIYGVSPLPRLARALPILRDINQTRLLLVTSFSVAVLAGLGWDTLHRMDSRRRRLWVTLAFWAAVGTALLAFWALIGSRFHDLDPDHQAFLRRQLPVLVGSLAGAGILALPPVRWDRRWIGLAGLGWIAFDLLSFGMGYNPAIPRDRYYPRTEAIEWLKRDPSTYRVLGGGDVLVPNTAAAFGLSDVRGCDFMSVRRYEELITGAAGDFFFYSGAPALPKAFPLLDVKYLLAPQPTALDPALFELVYSREISIYRHKRDQERALLLFDYQVVRNPTSLLARVRSDEFDPSLLLLLEEEPASVAAFQETRTTSSGPDSSVRITRYEPDEVRIEASLPRPGFLLLLDTYFPGWSANVNGRSAQIFRADYNFRAVPLPAGRSSVSFSYRPQSLRIGMALSAASGFALCAVWFRRRR
jgi:hypothetical protein